MFDMRRKRLLIYICIVCQDINDKIPPYCHWILYAWGVYNNQSSSEILYIWQQIFRPTVHIHHCYGDICMVTRDNDRATYDYVEGGRAGNVRQKIDEGRVVATHDDCSINIFLPQAFFSCTHKTII